MRPHLLFLLPILAIAGCSGPMVWTTSADRGGDPNQDLASCRQDAQKQTGPNLFLPRGGEEEGKGPMAWDRDHANAITLYDSAVAACMTAKGYRLAPMS